MSLGIGFEQLVYTCAAASTKSQKHVFTRWKYDKNKFIPSLVDETNEQANKRATEHDENLFACSTNIFPNPIYLTAHNQK